MPSALNASAEISLSLLGLSSAFEVIHNSAKSISLKFLSLSLFRPILIDASKLDPIIFSARFSSILRLHTSLILIQV